MELMTYEEYQQVPRKGPYTVVLRSGTQSLYYFGERHSYDPSDEEWTVQKRFWREFLEASAGGKQIVFVEGGTRSVESDETQAILKHGGMGLATYLAHQEGIATHSPEPDERYERGELEKRFSREAIQYHYFARVVHQWGRMQEPKPDFEAYMKGFLKDDQKQSGWTDFDFSLEGMKQLHRDLFHTDFDEHDTDFFSSVDNPIVLKTVINEVSRASGEVRDRFIVREIERYLVDGYSIFAQYGYSHVVIQEPYLRAVFAAMR